MTLIPGAPLVIGLRFRLELSALEVVGEEDRWYSLRVGEDQRAILEAHGMSPTSDLLHEIIAIETSETMGGHGASLTIPVASMGEFLVDRVQPQDALRIELMDASGAWKCAFDGFVGSIRWQKVSSVSGFNWTMSITATGWKKMWQSQWVNWQAALNVLKDKAILGPGSEVFAELSAISQTDPITKFLEIFLRRSVVDYLQFSVRGRPASIEKGGPLQIASGRDWQDAFALWLSSNRDYWLNYSGTLGQIAQSVIEPDVHEMFWTYQEANDGRGGEEIPTLVFRPRPWPGPPDLSSMQDPDVTDDPGLWEQLDRWQLGVPGAIRCLQVSSSRDDSSHPNAFSFAETDADMSSNDAHFRKLQYGLWVDLTRVKKYGLSFRQVSLSVLSRAGDHNADYMKDMKKLVARVAYQEVGFPQMLNQSRAYPIMPGVHIGSVLEDRTDRLATGYITGVSHRINGNAGKVSAYTTLTVERVIQDVDFQEYVDAVRSFGKGLVHQNFVENVDHKPGMDGDKDASHSQPAVAADSVDPSMTKTSTGLPNNPNGAEAANIKLLESVVINPLVAAFPPGFRVSSGFRSDLVNKSVGGSPSSRHRLGLGVDLVPLNGDFQGLKAAILASANPLLHECFVEGGSHVHVSINQTTNFGSVNARDRDGNSA